MYPFLHLGDLTIPTYGLVYLAAFLGAIALLSRLATRIGIPYWKMVDLAFQFAIAGEIGARLLFVIVEWEAFAEGRISIGQFLVAGRVVLGGIVAGTIYAWWALRKHRVPVLAAMDAALPGVALGMGVGRIGCLMAGCCHGSPTDAWWGITFTDPACARISGTPLGVPLHPTQILQAAGAFAICAFLAWLFYRRRFDGQVASWFFVLAGLARFGEEFLRGDPRGGWIGLATSQWIGLAMAATGLTLHLRAARRGALERYEAPRARRAERRRRAVAAAG